MEGSPPLIHPILRLINERGLTQTECAILVGCSPSHFSRIVSGERDPGHDHLKKFAKVLRVPKKRLVQLIERWHQAISEETMAG